LKYNQSISIFFTRQKIPFFLCVSLFAYTTIFSQQYVYKKISKLKETTEGEKLYSQGKYDEAIKSFMDAINKGETRGEPQYYVGTIHEQRRQYEESIPYFEEAVRHELQPEFKEATVWKLILLHRKLKNYSEMLSYIDMLEDMGIKHPNLAKFRKESEENLSTDKIEARALIKNARKIVSDWEKQNPEADFWSENGGGNIRKDVINKYLEAVSMDNSLSNLYWDIAAYYEKLSEFESAGAIYQKIVDLKSSAEAYYKLGIIHKRNGKFTEARDNFINGLKNLKNEKIKYYLLINLSQVLYALMDSENGIRDTNEAILESSKDNKTEKLMDQILYCLHISDSKKISEIQNKCITVASRNDLLKKDVRLISLYYLMEAETHRTLAGKKENNSSEAKIAIHNYSRSLIPPNLRNAVLNKIRIHPDPESYNEDSWAILPYWCIVRIHHVLPFLKSSGAYRELYLILHIYKKILLETDKENYYALLGTSAYEMSLFPEAQSAFSLVTSKNIDIEMTFVKSMLKQDQWEAAQDEILSYVDQNSTGQNPIKDFLKKDPDMRKFPKAFMKPAMLKLLDIQPETPPQDINKPADTGQQEIQVEPSINNPVHAD